MSFKPDLFPNEEISSSRSSISVNEFMKTIEESFPGYSDPVSWKLLSIAVISGFTLVSDYVPNQFSNFDWSKLETRELIGEWNKVGDETGELIGESFSDYVSGFVSGFVE